MGSNGFQSGEKGEYWSWINGLSSLHPARRCNETTPKPCETSAPASRLIALYFLRRGCLIYSGQIKYGGDITGQKSHGTKASASAALTRPLASHHGAAKVGREQAGIAVTWRFSTPLIKVPRTLRCWDSINKRQEARHIVMLIIRKWQRMANEPIWQMQEA